MSNLNDVDQELRNAFSTSRNEQPRESELARVMARAGRPTRRRLSLRMRIGIAAPALTVAILAGVVAFDGLSSSKDGGTSLVAKAIAAASPNSNSIIFTDITMGMNLKENKNNFAPLGSMKGWQLGDSKTGIGKAISFGPSGKKLIEAKVEYNNSTIYLPKRNLVTSFKGTDWPSSSAQEKRFNAQFEKVMTDPAAFYRDALTGKDKSVKVGQKTTINNRKVFEVSISERQPQRIKVEKKTYKVDKQVTKVFIDSNSFKPVEMRIGEEIDGTGVELLLNFNSYDHIPYESTSENVLDLKIPGNARKISPSNFRVKMDEEYLSDVAKSIQK